MRELYFLCSRAGEAEGPDWAGSLVVVKTSSGESMYIAGATQQIAERLLKLFPVPQVTVVPGRKLLKKHHADFEAKRVAVIESEAQLAEFVKDRSKFPFEQSAVHYKAP